MKIHISFLCRIVTTLLLVSILTINFFSFFGNRLNSHYLSVASLQADKVASLISLNSVSSLMKNNYNQVSFIIDTNDLVFDTNKLNDLLKDSVNLVYQEIKKVEEGTSSYFEGKYGKGIIYEIPFHLFSDNVLYSGFGSKIPVKFSVIGDIKGKISSEIEEFGLNNALINLNLALDISSRVNVPLSSEIVLTKVSIPLYSKIFTGEIPNILHLPVNEYYSSEVKL